MSTLQEDLKQLAAQLKVERDALHLQAHLLKLDLLDEWQKSEKKWEQLNQKLQRAGTEGLPQARKLARRSNCWAKSSRALTSESTGN